MLDTLVQEINDAYFTATMARTVQNIITRWIAVYLGGHTAI